MRLLTLAFAMPATSLVLGWILFGSIATISIGYAKLKREWYAGLVGGCLAVYPYFFPAGFLFWTLGILLTAALFVPRRFLP
ncbi:hypothetical protein HAHE_38470 [Haloferula helveola]|uniref:Uncharacterized protein n=1 Tax=Haloferula helveola TaxID=490095 RepID=A0ABM7RID2_9BACT|nr:hypothetical protein HAHE_38470 [Haloferula helveola]